MIHNSVSSAIFRAPQPIHKTVLPALVQEIPARSKFRSVRAHSVRRVANYLWWSLACWQTTTLWNNILNVWECTLDWDDCTVASSEYLSHSKCQSVSRGVDYDGDTVLCSIRWGAEGGLDCLSGVSSVAALTSGAASVTVMWHWRGRRVTNGRMMKYKWKEMRAKLFTIQSTWPPDPLYLNHV